MKNIIHNSAAKQINVLDSRYYTNDEKVFFPSVTTILEVYPKGFGFQQWLKDVGNNASEIADRAAAVGSKIHQACEKLNAGEELKWTDEHGRPLYDLQEWEMLLKYAEFWKATGARLISNEESFCSEELGYGGTLDLVVEIDGRRWLIDIKTSNYLHTSHELQVAAYAKMWDQVSSDKIDQTAILWLKASTKTSKADFTKNIFQGSGWQLKTFDRHHDEAYGVFSHVHSIWKEENPNYKPANLIYPDRIQIESQLIEV